MTNLTLFSNTKKIFFFFFLFSDHSCGYFSLLPNLIKGYGWNPGKKIFHWFGNALYEQTGNADITFSEVCKSGFI